MKTIFADLTDLEIIVIVAMLREAAAENVRTNILCDDVLIILLEIYDEIIDRNLKITSLEGNSGIKYELDNSGHIDFSGSMLGR